MSDAQHETATAELVACLTDDALVAARRLLGCEVHLGEVGLRITEVEAYRHLPDPGDSANHCRHGKTSRNAPMWGPAGRAYVYLCYGIHHLLNVTTGVEGQGAAVLIRACEPVCGHAVIWERRGRTGPVALNGPGKVGAALGLDTSWNHHDLLGSEGLRLLAGREVPREQILVGPRVGIYYARPEDRTACWRLALRGSPWVGHRSTLNPMSEH